MKMGARSHSELMEKALVGPKHFLIESIAAAQTFIGTNDQGIPKHEH